MALDTTTPITEITIDGVSIPLKGVTVYDGLDSTNTEYCLSANQGKVLDEKITSGIAEAKAYTDESLASFDDFETYDDTEVRQLITNLDNNKVEKETGKGLSTNDYTTSEKEKLAGLSNYNDTEIRGLINAVDGRIPTDYITSGALTTSLANYYLKSETYTKQEVANLISTISTFRATIVTTLPTSNISSTTIYLVSKSDSENNDYYDEYIYINNAWEMIGNTKLDLTNYYTKTETNTLLSTKASSDHTHTDVYAPATHDHTQYALDSTVDNLETNLTNNYTLKTTTSGIDTRVGTLETAKTNHEGRIATLEAEGGKEGPQGPADPAGASAGFGTTSGTVTLAAPSSAASVKITTSGDNTAKNFNFAFTLPKAATFSYSGTTLTITT